VANAVFPAHEGRSSLRISPVIRKIFHNFDDSLGETRG